MKNNIEIIIAPSILGLRPSGVELLAETLIKNGLSEKIRTPFPVKVVKDLNHLYSDKRDNETGCLNPSAIHQFSLILQDTVTETFNADRLALILGGDCSLIIGVMAALKQQGEAGLVFIDAHADFYLPHQSTTGEVADMDLSIVTGHGPDILTNINRLKPYVLEKNVVHIGQRDEEETKRFRSADIRESEIKRFDLETIRSLGLEAVITDTIKYLNSLSAKRFWIHFDTDVLSDEINPAVEYRIPSGLEFKEVEFIVRKLLATGKIAGMTVTIFNPSLDKTGNIGKQITECLVGIFSGFNS